MRFGSHDRKAPAGWDAITQLMTLLARGEPELIIFSGHPTLDDTDRRATSAAASVAGLGRLSRAWRKRPGDLGGEIRVFVAEVEGEAAHSAREAIATATNRHEDGQCIVEMVVAGQEQSRYRQLLIERGVVLYSR
jgi:hypothetical protein